MVTSVTTSPRPLGFIATEPARPGERNLAWIVVAVSLACFAAGVAFVRVPAGEIPTFIPVYEGALWVIDIIAAILLFGQFVQLRSKAVLLLASGYLFDGLMVIPHALTFPGAFAPNGLLGAGTQTTAWLYDLWHAGFPLFVLGFALFTGRKFDRFSGSPRKAITIAVIAVAALAAGLTLLATLGNDLLPVVVRGTDYSLNVKKGISPAIWALTAGVLIVLWRRSTPTVLEVWMMVVLTAWLLDVLFSSVIGSHRFDVGWYAGRAYGLLAAGFVLCGLLVNMNRLYAKLTEALTLAENRNAALLESREEFARVQRFEAIGQLVGGIAHDFNNMLTVITGSLDIALRDANLSDRNRRLLEASLTSAQRGGQINQQLLTFARRQVLRPEVVNPNEVISNFETFIVKAIGESIPVRLRLSPVIWPARLDRLQFETALINLVVNARDAMDGNGQVTIETRNAVIGDGALPDVPGGDYVRIAIQDTGCGMTQEVIARAFERFFTTKPIGKGTGLGLSQVYGFVRAAGGQLRIVSAVGQGTTVEMYLPQSVVQPATAEPAGMAPIRAAKGHETVLVVEDDPAVSQIAVEGLTDLGYIVRTAASARAALDILRTDSSIDAMFSDVVMPGGMNGAQLAVEARRIRPNLKILLTSGYTPATLRREHGLDGPADILPKPYKREELARRLRLVIGG